MSFVMRANTVAYIWKKLLPTAVELPNVAECVWQSNGDIHCLDEPIPTETEELLIDGDDDINDEMMTWNTSMGMLLMIFTFDFERIFISCVLVTAT